MAKENRTAFGALLRHIRTQAGLTQEELAELSRLSARTISDLERGVSLTARKDTATLLADALSLAGADRQEFLRASAGRVPNAAMAAVGLPAIRTMLPRDVITFTGRAGELEWLTTKASDDARGFVVAIGGMAGIGKTALALHAAHHLAPQYPDGQFFVQLHAHTPGQRPVHPAEALADLLRISGLASEDIPAGVDARANRWRSYLAGKQTLLVLDDAADHDQVRPLLPGSEGSRVLITSRNRLAALEDTALLDIDVMSPEDAAAMFGRLSGRPALDESGADVAEIVRLAGYLPLAVSLLARQLAQHPAWTPASLAADLTTAQDRLELMRAENSSVSGAFNLAYRNLTSGERRMFRRIGLQPGPDVDVYAAAAMAGGTLAAARRQLDALYDRHLLTELQPGRYQQHDLLRAHAIALTAAENPAAVEAAIVRLLDYYTHTAQAAGLKQLQGSAAVQPTAPGRPPAHAPRITTRDEAAAWLASEEANLHAAAGYAAVTSRIQPATLIPAAMAGLLEPSGHWDQVLAQNEAAVAAARRSGNTAAHARALMLASRVRAMSGDAAGAGPSLRQALRLYRELGDQAGEAGALHLIGYYFHALTGDLPAAARHLRQSHALFASLGYQRGEADVLSSLCVVQAITGDYAGANASARKSLRYFQRIADRNGQWDALTVIAQVQRDTGDLSASAANLRHAFALSVDDGNRYKQAFTLTALAGTYRLAGDYPAATAACQKVLQEYRDLENANVEGDALNELGAIQQQLGDYQAAATSHNRALQLLIETDDPFGQSGAFLNLGDLHSRTGATREARAHYGQALEIARRYGLPNDQAQALEGIGRMHARDGNDAEAFTCLNNALAIYEHIKVPHADGVRDTLARLRGSAQPQAVAANITSCDIRGAAPYGSGAHVAPAR